ncbi:MAG: OmpA family protein [Nitrospirota bacterium]
MSRIFKGFSILFISAGLFWGCAAYEMVHNKPVLFVLKELPKAERALEEARLSGAATKCPEEFQKAQAMLDEAYRIYWKCRDDEAVEKAKAVIDKAKSLCPPLAPEPVPAVTPSPPALPPSPEPRPEPAKVIIFKDVYFDFDRILLTKETEETLKKEYTDIERKHRSKGADRGPCLCPWQRKYNLLLGERRAAAVKEYLIKEGGISPDRLITISYGESHLAMPEIPTPKNKNSKEAKANRRVHFKIIPK